MRTSFTVILLLLSLNFTGSRAVALTCANIFTNQQLFLIPKFGDRDPQKYAVLFEQAIKETDFNRPSWDVSADTLRAEFYRETDLNSRRLQEIFTGSYRGSKARYLWALTEGEVLRFMPKVGLLKEVDGKLIESTTGDDEVSKHVILTQNKSAYGAGEFWFEPGGSKLVFDLNAGSYTRQLTSHQRVRLSEILTKKFQAMFPQFEIEVRNYEWPEALRIH